MKMFSSFFVGLRLPFKGLRILFKHPKYWKYASFSMVLNTLLYVLMFYLLFHFVLPWVNSWLPASSTYHVLVYLYAFIRFVIKFMVVVTFFLLFILFFNTIFFTVASPFLDGLSLKVEKEIYNYIPAKAGLKTAIKGCYVSIENGVWLTVASLFWTIVLFPLNLIIPVVGFVPGMLAGGYLLGLSFIIYSVEHRRITKKEFKKALKGNRTLILGLGLAMYWVLFIPFTAIFFIPSAVIAGTILYNEHCNK